MISVQPSIEGDDGHLWAFQIISSNNPGSSTKLIYFTMSELPDQDQNNKKFYLLEQ